MQFIQRWVDPTERWIFIGDRKKWRCYRHSGLMSFFLNVGRKVHIFTYLQENDWRGIVALFCVPRWWGFCWSKLLRNMVCIKKAKYFLPTESTFVSMRLSVVSTWSRFFAKQATKTIPCNFFSMLHKFTCFYVERTQECDEPMVI